MISEIKKFCGSFACTNSQSASKRVEKLDVPLGATDCPDCGNALIFKHPTKTLRRFAARKNKKEMSSFL